MLVNNIGIEMKGTLEDGEVSLNGYLYQNNIPILEENYVKKMNSNNGFSERRMFRQIASIPVAAHIEAFNQGYNLDDPKEIYRFLNDNSDYMTVERLRSRNSHNILVK